MSDDIPIIDRIEYPDKIREMVDKINANFERVSTLRGFNNSLKFTFETPSNTWLCEHNMNTSKVTANIYDLSGNRVHPNTESPSTDETYEITFVIPQSGYVILSF